MPANLSPTPAQAATDAPSDHRALLHAGFFLGNQAFYRELRGIPRRELEEICMTAISFTNSLYGAEALKRALGDAMRALSTPR